MATPKIKGFNEKEQKLFNKLADGEPHDIRELKKLFADAAKKRCEEVYEGGWGEKETDIQSQSYVRNSVRRLVRDGWVSQTGRGTYALTKQGKKWLEEGILITKSATEEGRKRKRHIDVEENVKRRARPKAEKAEKPKKKPIEKKPKVEKKPKTEKVEKVEKPKKKVAIKVKAEEKPKKVKVEKAKKEPKEKKESKGTNGTSSKIEMLRKKLEAELRKEEASAKAKKARKHIEAEEANV